MIKILKESLDPYSLLRIKGSPICPFEKELGHSLEWQLPGILKMKFSLLFGM